jgi:hypothetical protein
MKDKHVFKSQMQEWRKRSPLRRWRERTGLDVNSAAFHLGLSFSTYQKWDYGNGHPMITEVDGKLSATCNVMVPNQKLGGRGVRETKDWDAHVGSLTGVSLNKFMQWYHQRPTP